MAQCRYQFTVATMMRALLAKELRTLRPLAFCIVGLLALIVLFSFGTELRACRGRDCAGVRGLRSRSTPGPFLC